MRGETWKNLLGIDKIPNRSTVYEVTASLLHTVYVWVIDQVRGQDGWILAKFFFCEFMDQDKVEVHKLAKKKNKANIQPS